MKKFLSLFYWRSWTKELKQLPIIIHHKLKYILKGNSSGQAQIDGRHSYKRHVHRINLTICRFIWNCVIWICDIWVSFPSFPLFPFTINKKFASSKITSSSWYKSQQQTEMETAQHKCQVSYLWPFIDFSGLSSVLPKSKSVITPVKVSSYYLIS